MKTRFFLIAALAIVAACTPKSNLPKADNRADAIVAAINDPSCKYVVVASHRGDWRNYPENSIPAIESVIRMGVDQGYKYDLGTSMIQTDRPEFLIKYLESKGRR